MNLLGMTSSACLVVWTVLSAVHTCGAFRLNNTCGALRLNIARTVTHNVSEFASLSGSVWHARSSDHSCKDPQLAANTLFREKYNVSKCLSSGAAATTYLVEAPDGVKRVLKVGYVTKAECDFAQYMSSIDRRHFVDCIDYGAYDGPKAREGDSFMVMTQARGEELGELVMKHAEEPPPQLESLPTVLQALGQLVGLTRTMNESQHFQRDLQPANIFVADKGNITIIDYGFICVTAGEVQCDSRAFTKLMQQSIFVDFLVMLAKPTGDPHYIGLMPETAAAVLNAFGGGEITDEIATAASVQVKDSMRIAYKQELVQGRAEDILTQLLHKGFLAMPAGSSAAFPWEFLDPLLKMLQPA